MYSSVWQWLLVGCVSTIGGMIIGTFIIEPIFLWVFNGDIAKAFPSLAYFFSFFAVWNFIERIFYNES